MRQASVLSAIALVAPAFALAEPASVTLSGSFQEELGCPGDFQPDCATTHMTFNAEDGVWQQTFSIPAGSWQYKAALDDSWTENYGANAAPDGALIGLNLGATTDVKFYYDHGSHWVTDDVNSVVATAIGGFQTTLGCATESDPACLRSWLQDPDGDGVFTLRARLPADSYTARVALAETMDEVYGAGGALGGAAIPFDVATSCVGTEFAFTLATKALTITEAPAPAQPSSVTIAGSIQDEVGCPGDWQPDCASSHLAFDANTQVWKGTFSIPAGSWEYKLAIDDNWTENYGVGGVLNGPNMPLNLGSATTVTFYYDHGSHWTADSPGWVIAAAVGDFQSELGCASDWDPACLRSWLQDPDGDGIYRFTTRRLAAGSYLMKVALDESFTVNYGEGGAQNGIDIPFDVFASCAQVEFSYDSVSHVPTVVVLCERDGQCEDGNPCTDDSCDGSQCAHSAISCDDSIQCTVDTCDPGSGCQNTPDHSVCDNGQFCDGPEVCMPAVGCLSGTSPCVTPVECANDCDEVNDDCFSDAGTPCGDATVTECDGADTCDGAGSCAGNPVAVGTACGDDTVSDCDGADICDGSGACDDNLASDATPCTANGLFCDGAELCSAGVCASAGSPCASSEVCDETGDRCNTATGPGTAPRTEPDSGCSCSAPGGGRTVALIALAIVARRRRRYTEDKADKPIVSGPTFD